MRAIVKTAAATVGLLALITTAGCGPSDDELKSKAADACMKLGQQPGTPLLGTVPDGTKIVGVQKVSAVKEHKYKVELKVKLGSDGSINKRGSECIATWEDGAMHPKSPFN